MNIIELYNINNNIDVRANLISLKDRLSEDLSLADLKQDENYNTEIFAKLLSDEDSKVRKNTALIIGMIDESGLVKNLYEGYESEDTLFVRSAYLKALRKYDFSEYKASLTERLNYLEKAEYEQSELKHIAEELKELKSMVGTKIERETVTFRNPKEPVLVFLTCKKEMADILTEQVKEMTGLMTKKVFCGVAVKTADIGKVSCIRTYKELLFPLNGLTAYDRADVIREIIKGDIFKLLDAMHDKKEAVYNFRVSGNIDAMKFGREIETASYGRLVNSVSDYDIELRFIQNKESKLACLLKLFTKKDNRFAYRKNYVATSLHPVNAAGIVKMAEKYLEKYAQVLDPFCGVGTLLIERNKLVRARNMYGTDIFGEAVEGGRQNAVLAGVEINYICRNFFDFRHEYLFDEIITEMPRFEKGQADDFYRRFFEKAEEVLREEGIIIAVSEEMGIIKKYLRLNKNFRLINELPFNSKENINIYIIMRKRSE